jgi:hypothetical protein
MGISNISLDGCTIKKKSEKGLREKEVEQLEGSFSKPAS